MLLVDHDGAEAREVDPVLDERMRTDDDVDSTVRQAAQHVAPVAAGDSIGEELHTQRAITEQVARVRHRDAGEQTSNTGCVLLCEHLGRRHQGTLVTTLYGREQHGDRHDRLAGPDVALEESVHRMRRGQIGFDLADGLRLRTGERIVERVVEPLNQLTVEEVAHTSRL